MKSITIVGAGMSGLYSASLFASQGYKVNVIEKRPHPLSTEAKKIRGRSINFTLSYRGLLSLSKIGLKEQAEQKAVEVRSRMVHLKNGVLSEQSYRNTKDSGLFSITREDLGHILFQKASENPLIQFYFNVDNVTIDRDQAITHFTIKDESHSLNADFIIGADGVNSYSRQIIQLNQSKKFEQKYFDWVYKEFTLTQDQLKQSKLNFNSVHVWGRPPVLLLGLPNSNGTMTCNLIVPKGGSQSSEDLTTKAKIENLVHKEFKDLSLHVDRISHELLSHQWSTISMMKTAPWFYQDKMVLVGDACHAVVHFYAQGLNSSLEDCLTLFECIQKNPDQLAIAFKNYQKLRKVNTDALSKLSLQNFKVLISQSTTASYEAKMLIEKVLIENFPVGWKSQYSLVAHSNTPYSEIARISFRQSLLWKITGLFVVQIFVTIGIFFKRFKQQFLGQQHGAF